MAAFSKSELQAVNACRIYLQVTTLAEISNNQGDTILTIAINGASSYSGSPLLWCSKSKLQWPHQSKLPKKSWNLWN
jgi:hypothetical protein